MSDLDLTEAIEAAKRAVADQPADRRCPNRHRTPMMECGWCSADIAVRAAAPIVERAVRESIAAEIEARAAGTLVEAEALAGRVDAAIARKIARGGVR